MSTNFEDLILRNTSGNRPAAGIPGRLFYDTSNNKMQRDNGATWDDCEPSVSGTADNGWTAADAMTYGAADDPTYTMTCTGDQSTKYYPGMRIKLTQATGGTKYFIITKVAYAVLTTITLYGGTDYNLENEAISSPYYSVAKAPAGFPLDPTKWTVEVTDTSQRTQATPVQNTWYNLGSVSISIPIGIWRVIYAVSVSVNDASAGAYSAESTLSTATDSESDGDMSCRHLTSSTVISEVRHWMEKYLVMAAKTTYYLNSRTTSANLDNIYNQNQTKKLIIRAISAYL